MMTIRSHDQYNTTVYAERDRYRGISERRVVLLHADELAPPASRRASRRATSHWRGETRRLAGFRARAYDLPRGCAATYSRRRTGSCRSARTPRAAARRPTSRCRSRCAPTARRDLHRLRRAEPRRRAVLQRLRREADRVGGVGRAREEPRAYTPPYLAERILRTRSALEGERKQVTVLFADVRESMQLAESLGIEVWHATLAACSRCSPTPCIASRARSTSTPGTA